MDRRPLAIASGAFIVFAVAAVVMTASTGAMLGSGAGAFLTLAIDLTHGIFYRPLIDDTGIGGTRYFPLVFVLNALLIKLGLDPVAAGRLIALASAVALVWAAFRVLEALDVPRPWARVLAPLTLCSSPGVFAFNTIRGDLVPVMLNLWGVVFSLRALRSAEASRDTGNGSPSSAERANRPGARGLGRAIAFFTLAVMGKATAGYAVAAMAVTYALNGKPRRGLALALGTAVSVVILLAIANMASDGRMLESMRACMFGGGLSNTLRAPLSAVYVLIRQDPLCSLLLILFFVSLMTLPADGWKEPLTWLALAALVMTVFLFASPGVDINHLLDFYVVSTLFVGYQIVRGRLVPALATRAIAVGAIFTMFAGYLDIRHSMLDGEISQRSTVRALLRSVRAPGKPIFTSDGFIPSAEGERSYMLDNWMYDMLRRTDPRYDAAIQNKLSQGYFGAVVVQTDIGGMPQLYGENFLPSLRSRYELAGRFPPYTVFKLRP
jgi:hypothetical protein